jgi:hypothetical protein
MVMKKQHLILFLGALLLIGSCTSLEIARSWKAPPTAIKSYNQIMVVGIIRPFDPLLRQQMENHLVGDLKELGYQAYSSRATFGPEALESLGEDQIYAQMHQDGIDAVLTVARQRGNPFPWQSGIYPRFRLP